MNNPDPETINALSAFTSGLGSALAYFWWLGFVMGWLVAPALNGFIAWLWGIVCSGSLLRWFRACRYLHRKRSLASYWRRDMEQMNQVP